MNMFELINNANTIDDCVENFTKMQKDSGWCYCNICPANANFCGTKDCPTCRDALIAWLQAEIEE